MREATQTRNVLHTKQPSTVFITRRFVRTIQSSSPFILRVHMNVVPRSTMNTNGGTEN